MNTQPPVVSDPWVDALKVGVQTVQTKRGAWPLWITYFIVGLGVGIYTACIFIWLNLP